MAREYAEWVELLRQEAAQAMPTGMLVASFRTVAPDGWLLCDGSSVSKDQYKALYSVVGGTYGETSTTFDLPDLTAKTAVLATGDNWMVKT